MYVLVTPPPPPSICEQRWPLLERQPARLRDLVCVLGRNVPEPARGVAQEIEADHLEDPLPRPRVHVADVPDLAERPRFDPRLLGDLANGGLLGPLAVSDQ